jgi:hypothetical protein
MISQANESYHVGEDDDQQHDGEADECPICLRAKINHLESDAKCWVMAAFIAGGEWAEQYLVWNQESSKS